MFELGHGCVLVLWLSNWLALRRRRMACQLSSQWAGYLEPPDETQMADVPQLLYFRTNRTVTVNPTARLCHGLGARRNGKRSLGKETFSIGQQIDLLLLVASQYGEFCRTLRDIGRLAMVSHKQLDVLRFYNQFVVQSMTAATMPPCNGLCSWPWS